MRTTADRAARKPAAGRLQGIRRRAAIWKRRARAAALATLVTALGAGVAEQASAQMGQAAMAPAGGVVNRAVQGFRGLNENGPGILYYGINAADRGLGYQGSYMTLGGYVPGFEDDLGGLWAADLRGHLSVYGGFFSNIGAVRKQMIGGTLLGFGIFWDYDGDANQYPSIVIPGTTYTFAGGQVYNQVGISGEWLTDFGNIRSNGYIPVGSTADYVGPFVGNSLLCVNGVNAGLGGTDLEVGAYIPGLTDWAGMINVGGYAYGNARYTFENGSPVVPWFGGVYTRLDMTLIQNWDFSLQYNNDSYFDSTGFARLTYRMGGSRRRNVPDQMEQPMMRNEHIVRAHQTPVVATNPNNLDAAGNPLPWRVIHVDNTGTGAGTGTAESPFTSLALAQPAAVNPYDIVFVHYGNSAVTPYVTPGSGYFFNTPNQYFIGQGSQLTIPTVTCGDKAFFAGNGSTAYPILTNPLGPAIVVDQPGTVVSHFQINGSQVGISDGAGFTTGVATISDVIITGNGPGQRGVEISASTGRFEFDRLRLQNLTNDGFVLAADGGNASVTNSTFTNIQGRAFVASGSSSRGVITTTSIVGTTGTAVAAEGIASSVVLASSTVSETIGNAVVASGSLSTVQVTDTLITSSTTTASQSALVASGVGSLITGTRTGIVFTGSDAVVVSGSAATISLANSSVAASASHGVLVSGTAARFFMTGTSVVTNSELDGVRVTGENAVVLVRDSAIQQSGNDGLSVYNTITATATQVTLLRSTIAQSESAGIYAEGVNGANSVIQIFGSSINGATLAGVEVVDSNVNIIRDPTGVNGIGSSIINTGVFGLTIEGESLVNIANATVSAVAVGIDVTNGTGGTVSSLTANNNTIVVSGSGAGIALSGDVDGPLAEVEAQVLANRITTTGLAGISLVTVNPPPAPAANPKVIAINGASSAADLGIRNFGTIVAENPLPDPAIPQPSLIQWNAPAPALPPTAPVPTPP
jgi:hypothetical protein